MLFHLNIFSLFLLKLFFVLNFTISSHNCSSIKGGEDFRVYQWMMKHGGIPSEESYGPYLGADGYCHVDNATLVASIKGYVNVTSGDVDALRVAIFKYGPISVAIGNKTRSCSEVRW
jgi:hypothetical protein